MSGYTSVFVKDKVNETFIEEKESDIIQVSTKRWAILFMFFASTALNNMQWIQYSVIADVVVKHYNISYDQVNWTSMVFLLTTGIFVIPGLYFTENYGLRKSILLSTTFICIGSWVKVFSIQQTNFWVVLVGQSIIALSYVFVLSAPAAIAATWFGPTEVSLACSIGINGVLLGVASGSLISSLTVSDENFESNFFIMLLSIALVASAIWILQFFFFSDKPKYAPSKAQREILKKPNNINFFRSVLSLLKNRSYLSHLMVFTLNYGILSSILSLLNQFLLGYYENAALDAGRMTMVFIGSGVIGSIISGIILDKWNHYRLTYLTLQFSCIASLVLFTYLLGQDISIIYVVASLLGIFTISIQVVGAETSIELTYPESEVVVVGLLYGTGQFFSVLATYVHAQLLYTFGVVWANNCISFVLFIALIILILTPFKYNRNETNISKS